MAPGRDAGSTVTMDRLGAVRVGEPCPGLAGWPVDGGPLVSLDSLMRVADGSPSQALVVSFFATWCKPCVEGLQRLDRLARSGGLPARVLLVALGEEGGGVQKHLAALGVALPAVGDPFQAIGERWGVVERGAGAKGTAAIPRTFVVAPDRRVVGILGQEGLDFESILVRMVGADVERRAE